MIIIMGVQGFNRYNLFYRLERHLLLHQRGVETPASDAPLPEVVERYKYLELPPLPPRYSDLVMPDLWFVSSKGSGKKRSHRKSHGAASFTEIAQIVASNWKTIDDETMTFVTTVSSLLKKYIVECGLEGEKKTKKKTTKKSNKRQSSSPTNPHEISEESLNHSMMAVQQSPQLHIDIESHIETLQSNPLIHFSHSSATPIVNNLSSADMVLSHNDVLGGQYDLCQPIAQPAPAAPSQPQQIIPNITGSDDNIVNSTEQSFLSHIFNSNTAGESGEGEDGSAQDVPTNLQQQQTVTDLLTQMSGTSSNPRPRGRRASMPDNMPSDASRRRIASLEAELERRRGELHGGSSNKRQRRASTMGSPPYKEGMKEVDMSNEEIFQIWKGLDCDGPSYTPTGRNRAA